MRRRALLAALLLAAGLARPALAVPTRYLAFGDSITFGFGDDPDREEPGYPPRLQSLLVARGIDAVVENDGLNGEATPEAVTRIQQVVRNGGDFLLLMEGTNDINEQISPETTRFNLAKIAQKAAGAGVATVHATILPRLPTANRDGMNRLARQLSGEIRDLAWQEDRRLVDPFQVFLTTPDAFTTLYLGGDDKLHPNAPGYDLLAKVFADALTNVDLVPPVTGIVDPTDDEQNVSPTTPIAIDLYDFGAGIDVASVQLKINGQVVAAPVTGSERKLQIRYQTPDPFKGVVFVNLSARDKATPPNAFDGQLVQFVIQGTDFLKGDIDRDGRVDGSDLVNFAARFGSRRGDTRFRTFADFNGDDVVDGADLALLAANFGKSSF